MTEPKPPEGVQLILRGGRLVPVDVYYLGTDEEGLAVWEVITDVTIADIIGIKAAMLPGRATLSVRMRGS
jgi:hypothetical protein